jgi:hypothetical protein
MREHVARLEQSESCVVRDLVPNDVCVFYVVDLKTSEETLIRVRKERRALALQLAVKVR